MDDSSQSASSVIEDESKSNFHVPLALRKTPRAHAGINPFRMELCENTRPKELGTGKKRTLSTGSNGSKESRSSTPQPPPLKKKRKAVGQNRDSYCWICHKDCSNLMSCEACPRVFHPRCVGYETAATHEWFCSECEKVVSSENVDTRSKAMKMLTIDQLCSLLKYALNRMKEQGDEAFLKPVSLEQFPNYIDFVFMPMDLSTLEKNIKKKMYGCTESFLADAKWILHNCIIFNGYHHKLTSSAKQIVKICKHEMNEIEACPDCYLHAYTKRSNWFCEPCREPHLLVWAKLKGFPFWPAKAMKVANGNVDARFFGAHDRAWIPVNQCFLLSKDIPTPLKNKKKGNFELSVEELELHIQKLKDLYGAFQYAPFRTTLEVEHVENYIHVMLPEAVFDLTPNATPFLPNKRPKLQVSSLSPQMSSRETTKEESKRNSDGGRMTVIKQSVKDENPKPPINLSSQDKAQGNAAVPSGVFESSKDIPCPLDLQIPKLDLTKVPKPRLESIKKLESAIERLKDSTSDKTEEEAKEKWENQEQVKGEEAVDDSTQKIEENNPNFQESQNNSSLQTQSNLEDASDNNPEGKLSISQSCEVTSTTNLTELTVDIPPPPADLFDNQQPSSKSSTSSLNSPKKTNIYTQKLDQMIESCKAKLGINEIREDLSSEESSDEESPPKLTVLSPKTGVKEENNVKENESGSGYKAQIDLPEANVAVGEKIKSNKSKAVSKTGDELETPSDETPNHSTQLRQLLQKPIKNQNESSKPSKDNSASSEKERTTKRGLSSSKDNSGVNTPRRSSETSVDVTESNTNSEGEDSEEGTLIIDLGRNDAAVDTVVIKENPIKISAPLISPRNSAENNTLRLRSPPLTREKRIVKRTRVNTRDDPGRKDARPLPLLSPLGRKKANSSYMYSNTQPLDLVRGTVEEVLREAAKSGNLESSVKTLQLEIEKLQWRHQQELAEIKHNTDLVLLEMRASMDSEKQRAVAEVQRQCEIEKMKAIDETKKKQWCAHCGKEAIFYCCWNTSYCDYPCQQAHWPQHMSTCAQSQGANETEGQDSPSATSNITIVTSVAGQGKSSDSLNNQIQRAVSLQQGPSDTSVSPSSNKRQDSSRQGAKQAKNRDSSWHKRAKEDANVNYLQQERDKQRMHLQMQSQSSIMNQATTNTIGSQYSTSLGPSVQYIPSNAVQVIPQTSSLASPSALTSPSALQVQYVANIPQSHPSISMGSTSGSMPHFTTMSSAPAFPLQQSAQHQNHNLLHQQQQRSLQVSNSMYPIIIQSSAALGLSENSSGGRAYHPRGPYIPGKPYHVS